MTKAELKSQFQNSYNRESWKPILKLVFGQINYFTDPFSLFEGEEAVKQGCQIGYVDLPNNQTVAIFEIEVAESIIIERNRKGLRDIAAKYIKGTFSAALVFYYSKNQTEYRFSFVAQQSKIDEHTGEFNTVVTAPKRYTYVLGTPFCTTAADRWLKLAAEPEITVDKITDAFSVEKLSKEFFDQYKIQYTRFCKFIADDSAVLQQFIDRTETDAVKAQKPLRDYVKKLLGRLVFLQFLQKKGWMGVPATNNDWKGGDLNFMANLFDKSPHKDNFLDEVLEPLFFNTLNAERTNDIAVDIDSSIKIPYLNGGLFEKTTLDDTCVLFPKHYFSELFEFFNQYNFTIDENDPDDAEVGIDPEMLGHIFENLLEDNKDKGAFYTPKEIVRYMCQESLIAYLHTHTPETLHPSVEKLIRTHRVDDCLQDKANATLIQKLLVAVKICDPAIGSGAFPMGMLNEIFAVRRLLFGFLGKNESFSACLVKKEIIQNNIYGVDIEQGAVDIARLRFWLALVVDEVVPQALPNLDYKIIQGNSLVESFEGHDLSKIIKTKTINPGTAKNKAVKNLFGEIENPQLTMGFDAEHTEANLNLLIREYFQINNSEDKHRKADIINDQIKEHIKNCAGHTPDVVEKVNAIDFNNKPFFLWHLYFADVYENNGFDIMIGNPPYLGQKNHKEVFQVIKNTVLGKKYHQRRMDLFYFFFHFGILNLKHSGILAFITTNYYLTATYSDKLRKHLYDETSILSLMDFNELRIFESAQGQHNLITILKKGKFPEIYAKTCLTKKNGLANNQIISEIINGVDSDTIYNLQKQDSIFEKDTLYIRINSDETPFTKNNISFVFSKMKKDSDLLSRYCEIEQGIVSGADKVSESHIKDFPEYNFNKGDGIFILTNEEIERNFKDEDKIYFKKVYKNSEIKKWLVRPKENLNVIYIKSDGSYFEPSAGIKNHLDKYKVILINRNVRVGSITEEDYSDFLNGNKEISYIMNAASMKKGNYYCLSYARRAEKTFETDKIVNSRRSMSNTFALETEHYYEQSDIVITTLKPEYSSTISIKFLLAVLNSSLLYKWFYYMGKRKGNQLELFQKPLSEVPIKFGSNKLQNKIIGIVEIILDKKRINPNANAIELEQQIDTLVYKLYELSYEEVLLIEPDFGQRVSVEEYEQVRVE